MGRDVFLTFDLDWAIDEVIDDFLDIMEENDLFGTLNVTHDTDALNRIRNEGRLELGIHPNFNFLLLNDADGDYRDSIRQIKSIIPEAVVTRSHALTNSSIIVREMFKNGIKYDLNNLIPAYKGLSTSHYPAPSEEGITVIPFIFEDDAYYDSQMKYDASFYLSDNFVAPRVFNFHPIHLFLNTDSANTYENARSYFKNFDKLRKCVNKKNYGTRDFFMDLVGFAKNNGWSFRKISEGNWT